MIDLLVKKVIEVDQNDALFEEYLRQPWFHDNKSNPYLDDQPVKDQFHKIFHAKR